MLTTTTLNVVIADDHPAVLAGIEATLHNLRPVRVTGTASNSTEIVTLLSSQPCDLLITDFAMPDGKYNDGLAMLSYLRAHFPEVRIILFTGLDGAGLTNKLLKLGVKAIVNKADDVAHLISAVYAVLANAEYLSPRVSSARREQRIGRRHLSLTKSEIEVLRLYVSGRSVTEIALQLSRTRQTISAQKIRAMQKLGVERDADLYQIVYESRRGIDDIFST
ncbi:response regulator transcription factor [Burkholderia sp. Ac-20392]|uniref:response regulator transcription factor n=1 Tax=Burkholderia sp. Ac-20392 TaxID=2703905 RepID=UPI00197D9C08|nr:response regulator transcription factor [Burkholderia sp. Ac-20392]MBN3794120.1 response regulator transcription factor [Burkholderia sp. Ac-20392]